MAGVVHIPWYATLLRANDFELGLGEAVEAASKYGATAYTLHRSREDRHKFLQTATFDEKLDFDRYWAGAEMQEFRTDFSSFFQVPVLYAWHDVITEWSQRDSAITEFVDQLVD